MSVVITYNKNILEDGTTTVTPAQNSDYPSYRLYDRHLGRLFKFGSLVNPSLVHVDQGASPIEIDTLLIPSGHNLDGLTLTVQYSDNNVAWITAVTWSQSGNTQVVQSFTAATHRYWRFSIASPSAVPQIGELFLTKGYSWARNPTSLDIPTYDRFNVSKIYDVGGRPRFIELGTKKRYRNYFLEKISGDHRTSIESLNDEWAGKSPFWIKDVDGETFFGELISNLDFIRSGDFADVNFEFLEIPD